MNKKNLLFSDSSTAFFAKEHLKMLIKASLSLIFYEEQSVPSSGFSKVIMTWEISANFIFPETYDKQSCFV